MRGTRNRTKALLVTIAVVVGALAVTACGSSKSSGSGSASVSGISDPVAKAATVSNSAGGYKMNFTMAIKSPSLPSSMTATGTGAFNAGDRQGAVNLSMNFGSIPEISALLGSSTLNLEEIVDGTTIYIKLPTALTNKLPGGKQWMSLNLKQLGSASGIPGIGSLLNNPTETNPASMLKYLQAVSGGVTKVGTANVNGYQTTEYRATIDFAKYPSLVPASQRSAAQQAIASLQKMTKLQAFPVTVFVDGNNLVRRMQFAFNETVPSAGSIQTQMTLNITGYGTQPAPAIPPASQVMDASSLLGAAGSALSAG